MYFSRRYAWTSGPAITSCRTWPKYERPVSLHHDPSEVCLKEDSGVLAVELALPAQFCVCTEMTKMLWRHIGNALAIVYRGINKRPQTRTWLVS